LTKKHLSDRLFQHNIGDKSPKMLKVNQKASRAQNAQSINHPVQDFFTFALGTNLCIDDEVLARIDTLTKTLKDEREIRMQLESQE
jgi:hypothetical protein